MQQDGGPYNRHVGSACCRLVHRQIELLHRFGIKSNHIAGVLCALVANVEGVTDRFVRGKIGERIPAVGIGCGTCQISGAVALRHLQGYALPGQGCIFAGAI